MSQGQHGPTYNLYGVISHAGGGPNSGHYYAHVKDSKGNWFEMNDESVIKVNNPPTSLRNAYILFYIRDKGQALQAALAAPAVIAPRTPMISGMKKRKIVESDDEGEPSTPPSTPGRFIGPRLPSPPPMKPALVPDAKKLKTDSVDPQATLLKKKIANASGALTSLSQYNEDDEDADDVGEKVEKSEKADVDMEVDAAREEPKGAGNSPSKPVDPEDGSTPPPSSSLPPPPALKRAPPTLSTSKSVPGASFYATLPPRTMKRKDTGNVEGNESKSQGADTEDSEWARTPLSTLGPGRKSDRVSFGNPYNRSSFSNNLNQNRDTPKKPFVSTRYGGPRRRGFAI